MQLKKNRIFNLVVDKRTRNLGFKDFSQKGRIQRFKNSKIQRFNSAKAGIGFKKYSVAFCASVLLWQKIQRFKDSRIQKKQLVKLRAFVAKK